MKWIKGYRIVEYQRVRLNLQADRAAIAPTYTVYYIHERHWLFGWCGVAWGGVYDSLAEAEAALNAHLKGRRTVKEVSL